MYNGLIISKRLITVLLPSKTKKNTSHGARNPSVDDTEQIREVVLNIERT